MSEEKHRSVKVDVAEVEVDGTDVEADIRDAGQYGAFVDMVALHNSTAQESKVHVGLLVQKGSVSFNPNPFRVTFQRPYKTGTTPTVFIAITGFDISNQQDIRLACGATEITETGFMAKLNTWANTGIFAAWADWIAIGEANLSK